MLVELAVRDLGVIAELRLVLGPGLTAVTGETGAGKTLVVGALQLLLGARADASLVRPGAVEAVVEARFAHDGDEVVLSRVVPQSGRSRAYVDGQMASVGRLAEVASQLVDFHGQHAHQSLLTTAAQRHALDAFAGVDLRPLLNAQAAVRDIDERLAALGGDERTRARELDLLRFQLDEIDRAGIASAEEDDDLAKEEERLAGAAAHREAGALACAALGDDGGALDSVGAALAAIAGRSPFAEVETRFRAVAAELAELAADTRSVAEQMEEDPERLGFVQDRRRLLADLRRKYGESLADVLAYRDEVAFRIAELERHEETVAELARGRADAVADCETAAAAIRATRAAAAPRLANAIESELAALAMPRASFRIEVGDAGAGDDVTMMLAANPGEPALPLARAASGGELARTMLAVRLVLSRTGASATDAATLVFDEVDAGIGGEAALAVGRALATVARERQVLVVTHLPQVAAFADAQVRVAKSEIDGRTVSSAAALDAEGRVVELSRMLSGRADSGTARDHAAELLALAASERAGT